ncbi:Nuclear hormone receptor [Sarcoptes scabiei]|nr:Nuclear hormone receptor [Sarcoptes scabiei]
MANLIDQSIANNLEQSSTTSSSSSSPASFHSTTIISTSIDLNPSIFEHQNGSTKNLLQTNNDNELTMPMMMMMVTEFSSIISSADESYSTSATTTSVTQSSFIERMHYIKIALLALMFILILCGNTFVLIALNNRKLRKNRMYFFLAHLSIADLVTGFFNVLPQLAWEAAKRFYGGNFLCKTIKFLQILGPYLSSYVLVMTAIDRYQAICYPLSNSFATKNTRRSRWMIAIAWFISLSYCTPQCFIFSYQRVSYETDDYECWGTFQQPWMSKVYVTWYAISVFIVPFLILLWTHYFICREIWINWQSKRQSLLAKNSVVRRTALANSNSINSNHHHHHHHHLNLHQKSSNDSNQNENHSNLALEHNNLLEDEIEISPPKFSSVWSKNRLGAQIQNNFTAQQINFNEFFRSRLIGKLKTSKAINLSTSDRISLDDVDCNDLSQRCDQNDLVLQNDEIDLNQSDCGWTRFYYFKRLQPMDQTITTTATINRSSIERRKRKQNHDNHHNHQSSTIPISIEKCSKTKQANKIKSNAFKHRLLRLHHDYRPSSSSSSSKVKSSPPPLAPSSTSARTSSQVVQNQLITKNDDNLKSESDNNNNNNNNSNSNNLQKNLSLCELSSLVKESSVNRIRLDCAFDNSIQNLESNEENKEDREVIQESTKMSDGHLVDVRQSPTLSSKSMLSKRLTKSDIALLMRKQSKRFAKHRSFHYANGSSILTSSLFPSKSSSPLSSSSSSSSSFLLSFRSQYDRIIADDYVDDGDHCDFVNNTKKRKLPYSKNEQLKSLKTFSPSVRKTISVDFLNDRYDLKRIRKKLAQNLDGTNFVTIDTINFIDDYENRTIKSMRQSSECFEINKSMKHSNDLSSSLRFHHQHHHHHNNNNSDNHSNHRKFKFVENGLDIRDDLGRREQTKNSDYKYNDVDGDLNHHRHQINRRHSNEIDPNKIVFNSLSDPCCCHSTNLDRKQKFETFSISMRTKSSTLPSSFFTSSASTSLPMKDGSLKETKILEQSIKTNSNRKSFRTETKKQKQKSSHEDLEKERRNSLRKNSNESRPKKPNKSESGESDPIQCYRKTLTDQANLVKGYDDSVASVETDLEKIQRNQNTRKIDKKNYNHNSHNRDDTSGGGSLKASKSSNGTKSLIEKLNSIQLIQKSSNLDRSDSEVLLNSDRSITIGRKLEPNKSFHANDPRRFSAIDVSHYNLQRRPPQPKRLNNSNPRIHSMHGLTRAKIKTVKITLVIITCYVLCSTPFICVQLWAELWPNAQESSIYKDLSRSKRESIERSIGKKITEKKLIESSSNDLMSFG